MSTYNLKLLLNTIQKVKLKNLVEKEFNNFCLFLSVVKAELISVVRSVVVGLSVTFPRDRQKCKLLFYMP